MQFLRTVALNIMMPGLGLATEGKVLYAYMSATLAVVVVMLCCRFNLPDTGAGVIATLLMVIASQAITSAASISKGKKQEPSGFKTLLFITAHAATIALLLKYPEPTINYRIYFIPSPSMEPTLQIGDLVLANTQSQHASVRIGDIVIFRPDTNKDYFMIKRAAQKPEALIKSDNDNVYLLGDNPSQSTDSRNFGTIKKQQIVGKATWVIINLNDWKRKLINLR